MAQHDELDDPLDLALARGNENATNSGVIGFIFAGVGIGLLVIVGFLWYFIDDGNREQKRWMLYWFVILDVLSFFAAMVACIMGGRGLTPSNTLYRGWSLTALILGLIEIIITLFFGLFLMCCVIAPFEIFR
jgi:hypothetical protein